MLNIFTVVLSYAFMTSNLSCNIYQLIVTKAEHKEMATENKQKKKVFINLTACVPSPNSTIRHNFYKMSPSSHASLVCHYKHRCPLTRFFNIWRWRSCLISTDNNSPSPPHPLFTENLPLAGSWSELNSNMCYGYSTVFSHANLRFSWFQTFAVFWWCMFSSGQFPGVWILYADVSQFSNLVTLHLPVYEDGTECSETSAYNIQTPGNYPEENIQRTWGYFLLRNFCNFCYIPPVLLHTADW